MHANGTPFDRRLYASLSRPLPTSPAEQAIRRADKLGVFSAGPVVCDIELYNVISPLVGLDHFGIGNLHDRLPAEKIPARWTPGWRNQCSLDSRGIPDSWFLAEKFGRNWRHTRHYYY